MMIIISLFFAIFVADNFVQIVVPDINLDNLFASCFWTALAKLAFQTTFLQKWLKGKS